MAVSTDALRLAQQPPWCPGYDQPVSEGEVDKDGIAMCPVCKKWCEAYPVLDDATKYTIEAHGPVLPRRTPGAFLHLFHPAEAVL